MFLLFIITLLILEWVLFWSFRESRVILIGFFLLLNFYLICIIDELYIDEVFLLLMNFGNLVIVGGVLFILKLWEVCCVERLILFVVFMMVYKFWLVGKVKFNNKVVCFSWIFFYCSML